LAGISLPWVQIHVVGDRLKAEGPLLITHKGLSGPAVLRLSAWGARQLHPLTYRFEIAVNWVAQRAEDVGREVDRIKREEARRQVGSQSRFDLPLRLWQALVTAAGIPADQQWAQLRREQREALLRQLTDARFRVNGKATNKEEFTTAGGVDLREVDFRDFRSKLHPTLHLAGEVLDIDAITGGFNFQAAWTGGYLIGSGGN
jgi:predicted Rossmann fold flavoprotein